MVVEGVVLHHQHDDVLDLRDRVGAGGQRRVRSEPGLRNTCGMWSTAAGAARRGCWRSSLSSPWSFPTTNTGEREARRRERRSPSGSIAGSARRFRRSGRRIRGPTARRSRCVSVHLRGLDCLLLPLGIGRAPLDLLRWVRGLVRALQQIPDSSDGHARRQLPALRSTGRTRADTGHD